MLFEAGFESEIADWQWIREEPTGWSIVGEGFELQSLNGTLWEANNNTFNIALRPPPAGTFTLEIEVSGAVASPAEQGGLLWYASDDDYVKLVREQVGREKFVVLVTETAGVPVVDYVSLTGADEARLRMELLADGLRASYRLSPEDPWTELAETTRELGGGERLGLFSQGADGARWTRFEDWTLSTP